MGDPFSSLVQAASGGPAIETVYAYGPANRLLSSESAVETNVYTFDAAGRLVGQTVNGQTRTYGYDFQSRMTSLTDTNGLVFSYAFDGEGNRVRQSVNDCLTTRFVYDEANVVMELNGSNEVVWAYVNGAGMDQPVERIAFINGTARNRQVVHADGLGSVSVMTDESGEPVQTYTYAAFGGVRAQTGTDLNRVTFTAREALGDSLGFIYYRHRVYDPTTGRFTSEDPMGFVDGANRYLYCANNPIIFIDPFGDVSITLGGKLKALWVSFRLAAQLYGGAIAEVTAVTLEKARPVAEKVIKTGVKGAAEGLSLVGVGLTVFFDATDTMAGEENILWRLRGEPDIELWPLMPDAGAVPFDQPLVSEPSADPC